MSVSFDVKEFATGLQQSIQETGETLGKLKETLKMVQTLCPHPSWEDISRIRYDSSDDYHKCTECGFEEID